MDSQSKKGTNKMPGTLNLTMSAVAHAALFLIWMANASSPDLSETAQEDTVLELRIPVVDTDKSSEHDKPQGEANTAAPVGEQTSEPELIEAIPAIDYQGGPQETKQEVEPVATSIPDSVTPETDVVLPKEKVTEAAASSSVGQMSATVDSDGLLAPRLRISNLTTQLIDRLAESNFVRLVVTDTSGEVFVIEGTLSAPRGLKPIREFHSGKLSSRAIVVPRHMAVSIFVYLEANWGFRSTSVQSVAMHFSNAFDHQILNAQRAAVVQSGLSDDAATTICRFVNSENRVQVVIDTVIPIGK